MSGVNGLLLLRLGDVGLHGVLLGHALLLVPGVPLGFARKVKHARGGRRVVTHRRLLVVCVQRELLVVGLNGHASEK